MPTTSFAVVCVSAFYDYKSATALCTCQECFCTSSGFCFFFKFSNLALIFFGVYVLQIHGRLNLLSYESQLGMRSFSEASVFVSLL